MRVNVPAAIFILSAVYLVFLGVAQYRGAVLKKAYPLGATVMVGQQSGTVVGYETMMTTKVTLLIGGSSVAVPRDAIGPVKVTDSMPPEEGDVLGPLGKQVVLCAVGILALIVGLFMLYKMCIHSPARA